MKTRQGLRQSDVRRLKLLHVHVSPDARTVPITLRIPIGLLNAIKWEALQREMPYQQLLKNILAAHFPLVAVKCGGPGCSPYGNKNWKGPKPKGKKLDMRIKGVTW